MSDAWTKMRAASRQPTEYVKEVDSRKKRVAFDGDVKWYIFDGDEDSYDGDSEDIR